jgi:Domain of unknown function (DUF4190)
MSVGASGDHEPVPAEPTPLEPTPLEPTQPEPTMADPTQPRSQPTPWLDPTLPTYLPTDEIYAEPPVDAHPVDARPFDPNPAAYAGPYQAPNPAPYQGSYQAPGAVPYPYPGYAGAGQYPPPYPDLGTAPGPANYPPPVYAPPYTGYPPYGYPAPAEQTNTLAIVALVLSFFFWPAGLICGLVARRQITRTGQSGRGLATAAIVLGSLQFAFIALLIVAGIAGS